VLICGDTNLRKETFATKKSIERKVALIKEEMQNHQVFLFTSEFFFKSLKDFFFPLHILVQIINSFEWLKIKKVIIIPVQNYCCSTNAETQETTHTISIFVLSGKLTIASSGRQ
jgi:hypothetical protein